MVEGIHHNMAATIKSSTCPQEAETQLPANLQRKWIHNIERPQRPAVQPTSDGDFAIMTYNVLNDLFCPEGMYPYCPKECAAVDRRHPMLMKEIDHHGDADIICMQEVSVKYYNDLLLPAMQMRGFKGQYTQRPELYGGTDGCATFYRETRFELAKVMGGHFKDVFEKRLENWRIENAASLPHSLTLVTDSKRAYMFVLLRCRKTGRVLSVGNIHTTSDLYKRMDLTALEIAFAINGLVQFNGGVNAPHILCGDFNQEPHHPGYQFMRDGALSTAMTGYLRNVDSANGDESEQVPLLMDIFHDCFTHSSTSLQSAYKAIVGHEVPFSNYEDLTQYYKVSERDVPSKATQTLYDASTYHPKVRRTDPEAYCSEKYAGALDYIWFSSDSLHCAGVLEMVDEKLILPFHACPNAVFPSDHMPIMARFSFLQPTSST